MPKGPAPLSLFSELYAALRRNWPHYLAEAGGLALFIIGASLLTIVLEHPNSPLHQWLVAQGAGKLGRRIPLGMGMGLVIVALVYNPWGKKSGAHLNPSVTLAFWQLGHMKWPDACWYVVAQAVGSVTAALGLGLVLGDYYAHMSVHFITTKPGPGGPAVAFAAEFVISFGLMWLLLLALHSARLQPVTGWLVGGLLMVYIIVEAPLSGMSLNPFRTLSAAVVAGDYTALWVYLLAPTAAMCLATALFQRFYRHPDQPPTSARPPQYPDLSAGGVRAESLSPEFPQRGKGGAQ
ncbi:MIP/aquaporin family protein [Hymenobacter rubripertinctus]|uniref:MIP/aquaporin family protein n=1 Tax=Hymenobacter rubripertinctus TaxID=2029981 RepID=UPI0015FFB5AF|nr:aquaporin [Hymenobacter rubripertinctus]